MKTCAKRRQRAYLKAMGIPVWVTRTAAQTTVADTMTPEPILYPVESEQNTATSAPLAKARKALLQAADAPKITQARIDPPPLAKASKTLLQATDAPKITPIRTNPPPTVSDSSTAPRLRFFIIPLTEEGLVIGELPFQGGLFHQAHTLLVMDILRALNRSPASTPPTHHSFEWPSCPLAESYGDQGAMDGFKGFLDNQLAWPTCRWVLILGAQATRFTLATTQDFESLKGVHHQNQRTTVVTHSLTEIMKLPQLKAEAWLHMKPCVCGKP